MQKQQLSIREWLALFDKRLQRIESNFNSSNQQADEINLTPEDAARFLKIKLSTLRKYTASKKIPHTKTGKLVYFSMKDLREFITQNPIKSRLREETESYSEKNQILDKESEKIFNKIKKEIGGAL